MLSKISLSKFKVSSFSCNVILLNAFIFCLVCWLFSKTINLILGRTFFKYELFSKTKDLFAIYQKNRTKDNY